MKNFKVGVLFSPMSPSYLLELHVKNEVNVLNFPLLFILNLIDH